VAEHASAASGTAARNVARSAMRQLSASAEVAGPPTTTPGRGAGVAATGAKYGSISVAAAWATCRQWSRNSGIRFDPSRQQPFQGRFSAVSAAAGRV